MPSLVVPADANWMASLATDSMRAAQSWWYTKIQTEWSVPQMMANIDTALTKRGQGIYPDPNQLGFFICRPGNLPEIAVPGDGSLSQRAAELVIWVVKQGLPPAKYRKVLHGLFTQWLNDEIAHGEYEWAFGSMPVSMPAGDRKYLDDWGIGVTEYEERGATWRRYYGRIKDIVGKLPK